MGIPDRAKFLLGVEIWIPFQRELFAVSPSAGPQGDAPSIPSVLLQQRRQLRDDIGPVGPEVKRFSGIVGEVVELARRARLGRPARRGHPAAGC